MRSDSFWAKAWLKSRLLAPGVALFVGVLLLIQSVAGGAPSLGGRGLGTLPPSPKAKVVSNWSGLETQIPSAKMDAKLQDAFKTSGQVTYLVKLRTKADIKSAAAAARSQASPARANLEARSAVVSSLKETAGLSQRGLLADLQKLKALGQVSRVQSYWVSNMVSVTSGKEIAERIAKRKDVEKLYANPTVRLIKGAEAPAPATVSPSSVEWGINRVGAPMVWQQFGIDGTGVVVANMDTGVDGTHPALINQYRGYDPATGQMDHTYNWFDSISGYSAPHDGYGHGTHTMGTMVGRDPEGINEIGVAPGAKWIAAKIFDDNGYSTGEAILAGGQWILAPGGDPSKAPDVVNNSWGGGPGMDEWFRDIVIAWREAGIVPTFAAGNEGPGAGTIAVPGNYPESIAVGATDINDGLASFSNRGPSPYGEIKPELAAPGVNVRSSVPGGDYEAGWSGTSMATPHVSGVVALLRQADAGLTVDEIENILIQSADPTTNAQYPDVPNNGYGHGIVNAYTAVGTVATGIGAVSGRVLIAGDDLLRPSVNHTPVTEAFKHTDTTILAEISDNVSVTAAYLRFRQPGMRFWGITDMVRVSGDHKQGMYTGVIPADIAYTGTLEYYIEAVDYGNNHTFHGTKLHPHVITMLDGITAGYMQGFEGNIPGWQVSGSPEGVWEFGVPTSGPNAAHSGTRVAATNLEGNYPDNAFSFLISPPIDLTGGPAFLRFHHWYATESGFDGGILAVTVDGENWDVISDYTGSNGAYEEAVADLSPYAGSPAVFVAWVFISDGSVTDAGWYIDDVELYTDDLPPAAPANLTAMPTTTGSIALSWNPVSDGDLSHYIVHRSQTSGTGYAPVGSISTPNYIDASAQAGSTYFYVVTAVDAFGNESTFSNEASATAPNVTIAFFDNMEGGPGSWTHSGANDPWEWGVPTSGPVGAASGVNLWATALGGNYPASTDAVLLSPVIDLSGLSAVSLQFAHWYSLEGGWDFGLVEISSDGGSTWTQLAEYTAPSYGGTPVGWEFPLIDLSAYAGQTVQIRFHMISDSSVQYPGWYIDDVLVAGTGAPASTVISDRDLAVKAEKMALKNGQKPMLPKSIKHSISSGHGKPYKLDRSTGMGSINLGSISPMSLPVEGTVTVLETGRVVRTSPVDGSYQMTLPAGVYTLRAEAYGYFPQDRQVEILDGLEITEHFMLEPRPHGLIQGTVASSADGSLIEGALVWVAEDTRISPVLTDANGNFTLNVLAGPYTLEVRHPSYYPVSMKVEAPADSTVEVAVTMDPFIGIPGEIGYDDGIADTAWAFYAAGDGWAVRMTPQNPGQSTFVKAGRFYIWDETWPSPGGNTFKAAIFGAKPDGTPGDLLAGPVLVQNAVRGAWNEVDFSTYGVIVSGEFYIAYIQDRDYPNTTGLGFDDSSKENRTWAYSGGGFAEWDQGDNAMIRAVVSYGVGAPTITSPAEGAFLNTAQVDVRGNSAAGTIVTVLVDGVAAAEAPAADDGTFIVPVTLAEGAHSLTATAKVIGSGTTQPSAPVHVIVDLTLPQLEVISPADGALVNDRLIAISGTAVDTYLAGVTANGTAAEVQPDGKFNVEIIGRVGENLLTIVATDQAGNTQSINRTIVVDNVPPVLSNLQPATDQNLAPGDTLNVSFDSEPGLSLAAFKLVVDASASGSPSGSKVANFSLEPGEAAMVETSPGHYTGTWTVPANTNLTAAYVEFRAVDAAGNTTRGTASGVIHIAPPQGSFPDAVITGPVSGRVRAALNFSGTQSTTPNGTIVSYRWEMGDGRSYTTPTVRLSYFRAGTYTITLKVTDSSGATDTASLQLVISPR